MGKEGGKRMQLGQALSTGAAHLTAALVLGRCPACLLRLHLCQVGCATNLGARRGRALRRVGPAACHRSRRRRLLMLLQPVP